MVLDFAAAAMIGICLPVVGPGSLEKEDVAMKEIGEGTVIVYLLMSIGGTFNRM